MENDTVKLRMREGSIQGELPDQKERACPGLMPIAFLDSEGKMEEHGDAINALQDPSDYPNNH